MEIPLLGPANRISVTASSHSCVANPHAAQHSTSQPPTIAQQTAAVGRSWQEAFNPMWRCTPAVFSKHAGLPLVNLSGTPTKQLQTGAYLVEIEPQWAQPVAIIRKPSAVQFWLVSSLAAGAMAALLLQAAMGGSPPALQGTPNEAAPNDVKPRAAGRARSKHRRIRPAAVQQKPTAADAPRPPASVHQDHRHEAAGKATQEVAEHFSTVHAAELVQTVISPVSDVPADVTPAPSGVVPILASGASGPVHRCNATAGSKTVARYPPLSGSLKGPPGGGIRRRRQSVQGTIAFGAIDVQLNPVDVVNVAPGSDGQPLKWHGAPPPVPTRKGGLRRLR